jgi:hypothetical protein
MAHTVTFAASEHLRGDQDHRLNVEVRDGVDGDCKRVRRDMSRLTAAVKERIDIASHDSRPAGCRRGALCIWLS